MTQTPLFDLSQFETFEGARRKRVDPAFAIQMRGAISFNAAAYEKLGTPDFVLLMYNGSARQIALKAVEEGTRAAVRVRGNGKGQGAMVSAKAFLDAYDLPYDAYKGLEVLALSEGLAVLQVPDGGQNDGEE